MAAIKIINIKKRYQSLQALDGVFLTIEKGEFFGLLGPNGAGKTTLISIISGLSRPDSGEVTIHGHDVITDYRAARRNLGVVPQELVFDPFFTVRETLRIQSGYYGLKNNDQWINEVMENLDLTSKSNTNMRSLSGGMKRRVLVAQALVHKPSVIILDEPTAGVDVELRKTLWNFISSLNRKGHTVVLTTHYLEEAQEYCNRIAILKLGKIVLLDRTQNLIKQIAGSKLIISLIRSDLPLALRPLILQEDDRKFVLRVNDYSDVETILRILRQNNVVIENMQLQQTNLEDIFLKTIDR